MKAMIFGVTGQDGYYLSKLLLEKGYEVVGVHRRSSNDNTIKLNNIKHNVNLKLKEGDVTDPSSVQSLISEHKPDEVYNLAAQSHVATSFHQPTLTWNATACGCFNILEAIRYVKPDTKFYQASSSEMFGSSFTQGINPDLSGYFKFQNEKSPMVPQSPYAVAKLAAHHMVRLYRDSYNLFACSGILFNHESPMRGEMFVTRKITQWIGLYKAWPGSKDMVHFAPERIHGNWGAYWPKLRLGNLEAFRDWGHAEDYVEAMWMMLQHDKPDDYVVSTMETHSIKDFLKESFEVADLGDYNDYIVIDPQFFRPAEVDYLLGDSTKARQVLGWKPKHDFKSLVREMVEYDIEKAARGR
jgi:GDPmannose 4,6-dehydratase